MTLPTQTREQLDLVLRDGRWHYVSTGAALWYVNSPRYRVEHRMFLRSREWTEANGLFGGYSPQHEVPSAPPAGVR